MDLRSTLKVVRAGSLRARLSALRDTRPALRLATTGAALDLGILDALAVERDAPALAELLDLGDEALLRALLDTLVALGLLRRSGDRYVRTRRAEAIVRDPVVRATYVGFGDFHTGLYRDLARQLRGEAGRDDVSRRAAVIADLSEFLAPFVRRELARVVAAHPVERVLDVGCGTGHHLAAMLRDAPGATGVGVELDRATAEQARDRLGDRADIRICDVREALGPEERFDVVLLANVVYYWPPGQRAGIIADLASRLRPGGRCVVLTTALTEEHFARHFDLLLRAQDGDMQLPRLADLAGHLRGAGLEVRSERRVTPGEPLYSVVGVRTS